MITLYAFADEFGNNSFEFESQGSHFIVASVLINKKHINDAYEKLERIRRRHFQTGEIKSQKVGKNHRRRIRILEELGEVNFSIYSVIVDKRKLFGQGFKYKKSFYKYLNGIVYKELYRTFPELRLNVDEHGGNDFMRSFKKYVQKNHIRNLFSGSEFFITKSENELGVQLADFIAGTLGYIFDENKRSDKSQTFFDLIEPKLISLNHFPKEYKFEEFDETDVYNEYDRTIASFCLNRVFDYLDTTKARKEDEIVKINFLKLLLLYHNAVHHKKFTTAKEFLRHLNQNRVRPLSEEYFKRKIIGGLRDKGIILVGGRKGYKIPTSTNELKKFVLHGNRIILPMLRRIEECRDAILLATNNGYDVLNEPEFKQLKDLITKNDVLKS